MDEANKKSEESLANKKLQSLIERMINGDEDAFLQIITQYKKLVRRIMRGFFNNENDVESFTMEVFIPKFFDAIQKSGGNIGSNPVGYLARIANNHAIDIYRKQKQKKFVQITDEMTSKYSDKNLFVEKLNTEIDFKELNRAFEHAMERLPENHRQAVLLIDKEEYSYEKAASIMNVPIGTVKVWVFRGRAKLKEFFDGNWNQ